MREEYEAYELIRHGLRTAEDGMEVSFAVLRQMLKVFPNRELAITITKLQDAQLWLHESYFTISVGKEPKDAQGEAAE